MVAAVLRFLHLGHGIPFQIGIDEPEIMSRVVRMMKTGNFDPDFFDYPGLIFHLHLAVACVRFLVGAAAQQFPSLDAVGMDDFFLWGRALTALFGVATVFVVHQIGMRWGARHALLAAGLMAVMPMHVRESHYVLTDVPVTFFTALTMLLSLAAHERGTVGAFAWAGVAAGLAMGTKYTAGIAILMPIIAAWMTLNAKPSRVACVFAALRRVGRRFLVVAPYTAARPARLPQWLRAPHDVLPAPRCGRGRPRGDLPEAPAEELRVAGDDPHVLGAGAGRRPGREGPGRVRWTLLITFPSCSSTR